MEFKGISKTFSTVGEKQYESIDILLGRLTQADESFQCEQLSIF